jgi:hypothetical protein
MGVDRTSMHMIYRKSGMVRVSVFLKGTWKAQLYTREYRRGVLKGERIT